MPPTVYLPTKSTLIERAIEMERGRQNQLALDQERERLRQAELSYMHQIDVLSEGTRRFDLQLGYDRDKLAQEEMLRNEQSRVKERGDDLSALSGVITSNTSLQVKAEAVRRMGNLLGVDFDMSRMEEIVRDTAAFEQAVEPFANNPRMVMKLFNMYILQHALTGGVPGISPDAAMKNLMERTGEEESAIALHGLLPRVPTGGNVRDTRPGARGEVDITGGQSLLTKEQVAALERTESGRAYLKSVLIPGSKSDDRMTDLEVEAVAAGIPLDVFRGGRITQEQAKKLLARAEQGKAPSLAPMAVVVRSLGYDPEKPLTAEQAQQVMDKYISAFGADNLLSLMLGGASVGTGLIQPPPLEPASKTQALTDSDRQRMKRLKSMAKEIAPDDLKRMEKDLGKKLGSDDD